MRNKFQKPDVWNKVWFIKNSKWLADACYARHIQPVVDANGSLLELAANGAFANWTENIFCSLKMQQYFLGILKCWSIFEFYYLNKCTGNFGGFCCVVNITNSFLFYTQWSKIHFNRYTCVVQYHTEIK